MISNPAFAQLETATIDIETPEPPKFAGAIAETFNTNSWGECLPTVCVKNGFTNISYDYRSDGSIWQTVCTTTFQDCDDPGYTQCNDYMIQGPNQDNPWDEVVQVPNSTGCGVCYQTITHHSDGTDTYSDLYGCDYSGCTESGSDEDNNDSPCGRAKELAKDGTFKTKLLDLKSKLNLDHEEWYAIDGNQYNSIAVASGTDYINLPQNQNYTGYIHSHYNGLFSTFSPSDLKAIYDLAHAGKISDLNNFIEGVVTASGGSLLIVDDINLFSNFLVNNFSTPAQFNAIEQSYNASVLFYKAMGFNTSQAQEAAFLNLIKGSGLSFFKSNSDFSKWSRKKISDNGLEEENDPCN